MGAKFTRADCKIGESEVVYRGRNLIKFIAPGDAVKCNRCYVVSNTRNEEWCGSDEHDYDLCPNCAVRSSARSSNIAENIVVLNQEQQDILEESLQKALKLTQLPELAPGGVGGGGGVGGSSGGNEALENALRVFNADDIARGRTPTSAGYPPRTIAHDPNLQTAIMNSLDQNNKMGRTNIDLQLALIKSFRHRDREAEDRDLQAAINNSLDKNI